jgi:hypothetical protein
MILEDAWKAWMTQPQYILEWIFIVMVAVVVIDIIRRG